MLKELIENASARNVYVKFDEPCSTYADFHPCSCKKSPVTKSSAMLSSHMPPTSSSMLLRMAMLVPHIVTAFSRFLPRQIGPKNSSCCSHAPRVTSLVA